MNPPPGCRFHTRCPHAEARCSQELPVLRESAPGHLVACHLAESLPVPAGIGAAPGGTNGHDGAFMRRLAAFEAAAGRGR